MLFIDARHIYRQIDRAHRDFTPEQIEFLANIVRLYRGEEPRVRRRQPRDDRASRFPDGTYVDVPGLCKVATIDEIEAQGWSLNPGRYVGTARRPKTTASTSTSDAEELFEEFSKLSDEADELASARSTSLSRSPRRVTRTR